MKLHDVAESPPEMYELQRTKPLNEHLEGQLLFFCSMNHAEAHAAGECPGRPELMINQGLASDWIQEQLIHFKLKYYSTK